MDWTLISAFGKQYDNADVCSFFIYILGPHVFSRVLETYFLS